MYYGLAWADDSRTCFYVRPDDAMRPNEVWRHTLGTPVDDDVLVLREDDEYFTSSVERTRSGRFVLIDSGVEDDVRGVVRPERRARRIAALDRRRASPGTSTASSTTGARNAATGS